MLRYFQIFVIVAIFSTLEVRSDAIIQSVVKFCSFNGFKFVSFLENTPDHDKNNLSKEANKNGIRSKFLLSENIESFTDTLVIFDGFNNDFEHSLKIIQSRKILKSILVVKEERMDLFQTQLENIGSNSLFYLLSYNETNLNWQQVFTLKDKYKMDIVINNLKFDSSGRVIENYDFKGIKIITNSMTWSPYISLVDCNEKGTMCSSYGSLVDLMSFWARDFNFTWEIHDNLNRDWGMKPKSGKLHIIFFDSITCIVAINGFSASISNIYRHGP